MQSRLPRSEPYRHRRAHGTGRSAMRRARGTSPGATTRATAMRYRRSHVRGDDRATKRQLHARTSAGTAPFSRSPLMRTRSRRLAEPCLRQVAIRRRVNQHCEPQGLTILMRSSVVESYRGDPARVRAGRAQDAFLIEPHDKALARGLASPSPSGRPLEHNQIGASSPKAPVVRSASEAPSDAPRS